MGFPIIGNPIFEICKKSCNLQGFDFASDGNVSYAYGLWLNGKWFVIRKSNFIVLCSFGKGHLLKMDG